jgi:Trm5-related predicted tRNA methylase
VYIAAESQLLAAFFTGIKIIKNNKKKRKKTLRATVQRQAVHMLKKNYSLSSLSNTYDMSINTKKKVYWKRVKVCEICVGRGCTGNV